MTKFSVNINNNDEFCEQGIYFKSTIIHKKDKILYNRNLFLQISQKLNSGYV